MFIVYFVCWNVQFLSLIWHFSSWQNFLHKYCLWQISGRVNCRCFCFLPKFSRFWSILKQRSRWYNSFSRCRLTNHGNQPAAAAALIFTSPPTLSWWRACVQSSANSSPPPPHHTYKTITHHTTAMWERVLEWNVVLIQAGNALEPTVKATHSIGSLPPNL